MTDLDDTYANGMNGKGRKRAVQGVKEKPKPKVKDTVVSKSPEVTIDPYDNIRKKIRSDYFEYTTNLKDLDERIVNLQKERDELIYKNNEVTALFKATEQFNIEEIIFNNILTDTYVSKPTILAGLCEILNCKNLPNHVKDKVDDVLKSKFVVSSSYGFRKVKIEVLDLDDEDED